MARLVRSELQRRLSFVLVAAMVALSCAIAGAADQSHPQDPARANKPGASDSLSKQLEHSDGVIKPPRHVDPEMPVVPPSSSDKMPVIPPPGTPGGNPNVVPK